ncbi:UNVERIFIED_CONTAM: DNA-directed primase/polymerase protein [Sesamum radiatum]|uniref:DNA-directed primase/polymerase protein n=1 Tax=Sesamum radiatum TaxID=300843 RepID=A0AAW2KEC8_SESRA
MKQSAVREKRREKRKLKQERSPQLQASTISENKSVNSKTNGKQFSPVVFYGSPHGVPPKRPARLLRLLHEIRVDLAEQNKLRYKEMNSKFRHHYEVIQEGLPCHLYFDLEFNKKGNTDRNGDEMVDLLIVVIFDALLEKYSIQGTEDFIVELDSSTEGKFSRHLIIRLPKTAFKDNSHVGAFVSEICGRIQSYRERDENFEKLFVSKGSSSADSHCQLFVDTAVYSRNRCFRLPLSSKAGKSSVLLPSGRFKCKDMITNNIQKYPGFPEKFDLSSCTSDASTNYLMGKSPYPALDVFVEAIASNGNVPGKIRSWYWFSEYGLMVYSMSRNRYCERIGREHKSNHVIYVVDLRRAVYYQKCHDPDCQGYRSPLRPVPDDVIPDPALIFNLDGDNYSEEQTKPTVDGSFTDSCKKEWWHEAIKVAEQVEKIQKALDLTQMVRLTSLLEF